MRTRTAVMLIVLALLCNGCAVAAGSLAGGLGGAIIGDSMQMGKPDTPVSCPSCMKLPDGMSKAEYEQQLREKMRQEHGLPPEDQQ